LFEAVASFVLPKSLFRLFAGLKVGVAAKAGKEKALDIRIRANDRLARRTDFLLFDGFTYESKDMRLESVFQLLFEFLCIRSVSFCGMYDSIENLMPVQFLSAYSSIWQPL